MLDSYAQDVFDKNINMMVPYYLMASYAYYEQDDAIFSDGFFDEMGKIMLERWDEIEHFHKEYITKDDLQAGTFLGKYPSRVEGGLKSLREETAPKKRKRNNKVKPKPPPANTMGNFGMGLFDFGDD
tara:strand:- start:407 stop:787 length:381 start_codon:yes stop_codon:yes gene_type:complete